MPAAQNAVEVFYSYAHADKRWIKRLNTHLSLLQRQGLISAWYDRQIIPGANWAEEIDSHLNSASVILLLISPDFLASDYCYGIEMKRALERDQAKEARVIPIILRSVDWQGAPFGRLQVLPTGAKPITTWSNKDTAFADVAAGIRRALEDLSLLAISTPQDAHSLIWNVPFPRNPFFLGHEEQLARIAAQLQSGQSAALSQPQAISGLGGIGKTQLAVEYAYRSRQQYRAILWASAESRESLFASYLNIAELLKLPESQAQEQEITVRAVRMWLQTHQQWLLILDNADEPDLLLTPDEADPLRQQALFLPALKEGHVLVTTRASALRSIGIAQPIVVEPFSPEDGTLFLLRRAGLLVPDASLEQASAQQRETAGRIVSELGGLPLALDQAGAYIEATGSSLESYLQIYQQHHTELLNERRGRGRDHPEPVAATWSLSFQRVKERNHAAAELLQFCAFLAADAIPEELFARGVITLEIPLATIATDTYLFDQAIEALRAYSLIARDPVERTLTVHRLVQEVMRHALPVETQHVWMQRAVLAVNVAFPSTEVEGWPACERLLSHALLCAEWIEQAEIASSEAARLLNKTAVYLNRRARYAEAEPLYRKALAINERVLGEEHPDTARSLNNLAYLYHSQGKYAEAEPLWRRALAIYERVLGEEHPDTAASLNNLAALYRAQGKYAEAEPLYRRALEIHERVLGEEHPDTARSLNNLADLYHSQGKYAEAEPLWRRALAINERVLGEEHPHTRIVRGNYQALLDKKGAKGE